MEEPSNARASHFWCRAHDDGSIGSNIFSDFGYTHNIENVSRSTRRKVREIKALCQIGDRLAVGVDRIFTSILDRESRGSTPSPSVSLRDGPSDGNLSIERR
jgi:hypothetical protein